MERPLDDLLVEAFQARQNELPELAQRLFTEALARLPDDPALLVEIARCQVERGLRSAAKETLGGIGSLEDDAEMQLELARAWRVAGDGDEALRHYRAIGGDDQFHRQAVLEAALLEERLGRMADAAATLALEDGKGIEIELARAVLAERRADFPTATGAYQRVMEKSGASPMATEAGYRLARIRLAGNAPDEAFSILTKVKAGEAIGFPAHRADLLRKQREAEMAFLERWQDHAWPAGDHLHPVWMVTGHPRSGTTLLARLLEARGLRWIDEAPAFGALAREMSGRWQAGSSGKALPEILAELSDAGRHAFAAEYRRRLADWGGGAADARACLLDKNPGLWSMLPSVLSLVPGWRGIVLLRDPRDVALSCYFQRFGGTSLGIACNTLEGAVDAVGHAYAHWHKLRQVIPAGRCIEIRYEDLAADPSATLGSPEILGWLPATTPAELSAEDQASRLLENPSYSQIEAPPHLQAVRRWERSGAKVANVLRRLDAIAAQFGYA